MALASAFPEFESIKTTDLVDPLETVPKSCEVAALSLMEMERVAFSFFLPQDPIATDKAAKDTKENEENEENL
jgi:hypothetical protein